MNQQNRAEALRQQLSAIEPGVDFEGFMVVPCAARLSDGSIVDCVYALTAQESLRGGLLSRLEMSGPGRVNSDDVAAIVASPRRMPRKFASSLRAAGESGMGYWAFTALFSWWRRREYVQSFLDFLEYPSGMSPASIKSVVPHKGARSPRSVSRLELHWCVLEIPEFVELTIPKGSAVYIGAPTYPMPESLRRSLSDIVAAVPAVAEAHVPQCFSPASSKAAAQCLVVVLDNGRGDAGQAERLVNDGVAKLFPPGGFLDIWFLKPDHKFREFRLSSGGNDLRADGTCVAE
jgi:hypothetical protein